MVGHKEVSQRLADIPAARISCEYHLWGLTLASQPQTSTVYAIDEKD
jgi:hypothetical protein